MAIYKITKDTDGDIPIYQILLDKEDVCVDEDNEECFITLSEEELQFLYHEIREHIIYN